MILIGHLRITRAHHRWVAAFGISAEFSRENAAVVRSEQPWRGRAADQQEALASTLGFEAPLWSHVCCRMFFQEHLSVM